MSNLFEEMHEETMDILFHTLIRRTKEGKQEWKLTQYSPISFMQSMDNRGEASVSQSFEAATCLNGLNYQIDLTESVDCVTGKADIFGRIMCEEQQEVPAYDFGLSYQIEKYDDADAEQLQEVFQGNGVIGMAEIMVSIFRNSEEAAYGFSYARYFNQTDIKKGWKSNELVKLGKKLMEEKRMEDFHKILLDIPYRKKLMSE